MSLSITDVGQASVGILSLFGGFLKKVAPPDRQAWLWTGSASFTAAIVFLVVKLLSSAGWSYNTFTLFVRVEYVLFGACLILLFAYIWTFRARTIRFANTLRIAGKELTPAAKTYLNDHPNDNREQLINAFAGDADLIWTSDSLRKSRFALASEYAALIALLAFSINLGLELLANPGTKPLPKEPTLAEENAQLQDVHFALNSSELSEDARERLSSDVAVLNTIFKKFPQATLIIEGYCDDQGGTNRNLALGYQRAAVVGKALTDEGVQVAKLGVTSYGKGSPLCPGRDEPCRRKNRRAHLRVVD